MFGFSWQRWLSATFRTLRTSKSAPYRRQPRQRFKPECLQLEGRVVPTTFTPTTFSDVAISSPGAVDSSGHITDQPGTPITLRSAVIAANAAGGVNTIQLNPGTYVLSIAGDANDRNFVSFDPTVGDLNADDNGLTIQGMGDGAGGTTIQQTTGGDRILTDNSTSVVGFAFTITGVTLEGGVDTTTFEGGGALFLGGKDNNTTVSNCKFVDNQTTGTDTGNVPAGPGGGAIRLTGGDLHLTNCIFGGTGATDPDISNTTGGAVSYDASDFVNSGDTSTLTVSGCQFIDDKASTFGGGAIEIANSNGSTAIANVDTSLFMGDTATVGNGGAIDVASGSLSVTTSTFTADTAGGHGGAIRTDGTSTSVTFSRFDGDTASAGAGQMLEDGKDQGTFTANDDWWASDTGPVTNDFGEDPGAPTITDADYLDLKSSASPGAIVTDQTTTVTSSFLTDSANNAVSLANLVELLGQPISFSSVGGVISNAQTTIQSNGQATATYTATAANASNSATGAVDGIPSGSADTVAISVNKAGAIATIMSETPDPTVTGQAVTVSFTVTGAFGNSPTAPTGNVVVSDGVNSATGTVSSGSATVTLFTVGSRTLTATYQGDGNFSASPASAGVTHLVNKADTTTTITADPTNPSVTGQSVVVHFSVTANSPGSGTPTGNVVVSDGVGDTATGTVASGQATITLTTAGSRTLTATYQGDGNYNASPASAGSAHTVNKADTTTAITSDPTNPSVAGQPVVISFSVIANGPGSGTPTGNVIVSDGVDSATGTVASGQATITLTTPGVRTLTATYQGDSNYNASPASAGDTHTVNAPPQVTTQPTDQFTDVGFNASFTAHAAIGFPAPSVQWQVDTGSGFNPVPNAAPYSGGTTDTLTITGATIGMSGYHYRALYTNGVAPDAPSNSALLTVNPAVTFSPDPATNLPQGFANVLYNQTITVANGTPPYTSIQAVNINAGGTGLVAGDFTAGATTLALSFTPSGAGTATFQVQVIDSATNPNTITSATYTLVISAKPLPPVVTVPAAAFFTNSNTTTVSGTADANANVFIYADNNHNHILDGGDTLITNDQLAGGATTFSFTGLALTSNAANDFLVTQKDAPAGVESDPAVVPTITQDSIAPTATLTTPPPAFINQSAAGTSTTTLTVTYADSGSGVNPATFGTGNITVNNGATVTGESASGNVVTYTITAPGGTWGASTQGTYTVSLAASVADLAGNPVAANASFATFVVDTIAPTATLTTPPPAFINASAAATSTTTLTVTYADSGSGVNPATFGTGNITVNNGATVTGASASGNIVTYTITAPGGTWGASAQGTYTVSLAGNVMDLAGNPVAANASFASFFVDTIAPNVTIGSPSPGLTSTGPVTFTVTYTDANAITGTLAQGNITLNTGGTATGMVSVGAATGQGTNNVSYIVTISNISGSGTLGISIAADTATDIAGNPAPASGPSTTFDVNNVTVNPPMQTFTAQIGVFFTQTFTGAGGTGPYALALTGTLPAGLSYSGGVLSGTPTQAGTGFSFSIKATDSTSPANDGPYSNSVSYGLNVNPPTIVLPTTVPDATAGVAYHQNVVATGGTSPYTYSIVGGALPAFMTMNSAGLITGTPHTAGTYNFTVKAVDHSTGTGAPFSTTQSIQLIVHPGVIAKITFLSQPKLFGTDVNAFLPPFQIEVTDKFGNPIDGVPVKLTLVPLIALGPAKFTATSITQVTTEGGGIATFDQVAINTIGLYFLKVQAGPVTTYSGLFGIGLTQLLHH